MSAQWSPTRCGCGIRSATGAVPKPSVAEAGETRLVPETSVADVADPVRTKCSIAVPRPAPGRKVPADRYGPDPIPLCTGYQPACRTRVDSAAPGIGCGRWGVLIPDVEQLPTLIQIQMIRELTRLPQSVEVVRSRGLIAKRVIPIGP